jgi:predicted transcriptional regulator of viral defense system
VLSLVEELGLLRSRDLESRGIPRSALRLMLGLGLLHEVAPGVWSRPLRPFDATVLAAKRVPQGVVCLHSALSFHGLLREPPGEVWLAIGEKARRPRCQQPPLRIVRFSGSALSLGIEQHVVQGVPVRVYGVAKTVADLFKYRNKLGYPVAVHALRDALLSGRCTPEEVLHFGAICRVTRTLAPYLELLMTRRGDAIRTAIAHQGDPSHRVLPDLPDPPP